MLNEQSVNDFSDSLASIVHDDCAKRNHMISIAAYFIAEKRGFTPNHDLEDWLEAERNIHRNLDSFCL